MAKRGLKGPIATSFKPGQSGNPSGLPKGVMEVRDIARQYTAESITTLAEIMADKSQNGSARVAAAESLLSRGWGKAPQTINVRRIQDMTDAELDGYIADCAARAGIDLGNIRGIGRTNGAGATGNGSGGLPGVH